MALKDFPELHKRFLDLQAQDHKIAADLAPLRAEMDYLRSKIAPLAARLHEAAAKFKAAEKTYGLRTIKAELAAIAKGTGGKVMSEGK